MLAESFDAGSLPRTFSESVVILLQKPGDETLLKNWRPISLINVDAKVVSKVLADRLAVIMPKIVSPRQKGFVRGRSIRDPLRSLVLTLKDPELARSGGAALFLDQEKAYDRVDHSFLFRVMERFGFGHRWIRMITTICTNNRASLLINGYMTDSFEVRRGVRQGDPLSPLLYDLVIEALLCRIQRHIMGIMSWNVNRKVEAFADDLCVFLGDEGDRLVLELLLDRFGQASGARINTDKCLLLDLGTGFVAGTFPILQPSASFRYLGIWFTRTGIDRLRMENQLIENVERRLRSWNDRDLSLKGRVVLINVFLSPSLWYVAAVQRLSERVIKRIKELITGFVWYNKQHMVSWSVLCRPRNEGGMGLLDICTQAVAVFATWWTTLVRSDEDELARMTYACLDKCFRAHHFSAAEFSLGQSHGRALKLDDEWARHMAEVWMKLDGSMPFPSSQDPIDVLALLPVSTLWRNADGSEFSCTPAWRREGWHYPKDVLRKRNDIWQLREEPGIVFRRLTNRIVRGEIVWSPMMSRLRHAESLEGNFATFFTNASLAGVNLAAFNPSDGRLRRPRPPTLQSSLRPSLGWFTWDSIVHNSVHMPKIQSLLFKFHHNGLWCGKRLANFTDENDRWCLRCGGIEEETLIHRYHTCVQSVAFWEGMLQRLGFVMAEDYRVDPDKALQSTWKYFGKRQAICVYGLGAWSIHRCTLAAILENRGRASAIEILADWWTLTRQVIQAKRRTAVLTRKQQEFDKQWRRILEPLGLDRRHGC